jgi:DNA-binding MarR family transcriptional regulator
MHKNSISDARSLDPMDMRAAQDSVDRSMAHWAQLRPDLDLTPAAMVSRLGRLRRIFEAKLEATFAEHGLNWAEFAMLVALQRLDQPDGVSQRQLTRELNLSSGTVSVRVERLCARELLTRHPNVHDRRNSVLRLTDAGRALVDQVAPAYAATQSRLLAPLDAEQWEQLTSILRTLLLSFEASAEPAPPSKSS